MRTRKGFTLIELLIVVVIIGILAAIAIPKFSKTKSRAYIASMKSDLRNLVTAEETFMTDSARYSTSTTAINFRASSAVGTPAIVTYSGAWLATNTHSQIAAPFSCGIGINTTNPIVSSAGEGEPTCQ